jgi:transcriptional regulator with XRE-family HTH domain
MQEKERKLARQRLDTEMRPYRQAARNKQATQGLLRVIRQALGVRTQELAEAMGVTKSAVFYREERERNGKITLRAMSQMAWAMGCRMVYGIVPADGKTLERLADERLWRAVLGMTAEQVSKLMS